MAVRSPPLEEVPLVGEGGMRLEVGNRQWEVGSGAHAEDVAGNAKDVAGRV